MINIVCHDIPEDILLLPKSLLPLLPLLPLLNAAPGSYVFELGDDGLLENMSPKELDKSLLLAVIVLIIIKKYNKFYYNNDYILQSQFIYLCFQFI